MLRMAYFSAIILAFALPVLPSNEDQQQAPATYVIYLDNSFSTTAKNSSGITLLSEAKEELYQWSKTLPNETSIFWFTNTRQFQGQSVEAFQQDLLLLEAVEKQRSTQEVLFTAQRMFGALKATNPNLIWYTDLHNWTGLATDLDLQVILRPLSALSRENITLQALELDQSNPENTRLILGINNSLLTEQSPSLRLFKNDTLITQTGTKLSPNKTTEIAFDLGPGTNFKGHVTVDDGGLAFDDTLYFNVAKHPKIKVLRLGMASQGMLNAVFDHSDFNLIQSAPESVDYSIINRQNLVILDGLTSINPPLLMALEQLTNQGGGLVFIPDMKASTAANTFLNQFRLGQFDTTHEDGHKVVEISSGHPLFKGVLAQNVDEFQYPSIGESFGFKPTSNVLLTLDNGAPYLLNRDQIYAFSGPLIGPKTNFDQSPLSVAMLIEIARKTRPNIQPYYLTSGSKNEFNSSAVLPVNMDAQDVVLLQRGQSQIIPRQQQIADQRTLNFQDNNYQSGHYNAMVNGTFLNWISFNYSRDESKGSFAQPTDFSGPIQLSDNLTQTLNDIDTSEKARHLWHWFAIFALMCFLTEMFLLKNNS